MVNFRNQNVFYTFSNDNAANIKIEIYDSYACLDAVCKSEIN